MLYTSSTSTVICYVVKFLKILKRKQSGNNQVIKSTYLKMTLQVTSPPKCIFLHPPTEFIMCIFAISWKSDYHIWSNLIQNHLTKDVPTRWRDLLFVHKKGCKLEFPFRCGGNKKWFYRIHEWHTFFYMNPRRKLKNKRHLS